MINITENLTNKCVDTTDQSINQLTQLDITQIFTTKMIL